jgi:Tfp pilus assembly protein FimT
LGSPRAGVSLLELLIVLGLLVLIGAMAVPTLERPLAAQKLRKAAELVTAHWDRARVHAMQHGQTMVFQYQVETGKFRLQPWYSEDDVLEASQTAVDPNDPAADPASTSTSLGAAPVFKELPEGIQFLSSISLPDQRGQKIVDELSEITSSAGDGETWSAPVLFYPDGTATTTEVMLANESGSYVSIRLRGLTGVSRIGEVLSTDAGELPQ